jgi:hypothetical protein
MSEGQADQERPCLHCMMVELIDDFFAEYPPTPSGSDKVDTEEADEVIEAIAKTVAELTSKQDGLFRQHLIEQLMRGIMNYDAEFRREDPAGTIGPQARHWYSYRDLPSCGVIASLAQDQESDGAGGKSRSRRGLECVQPLSDVSFGRSPSASG